MPTPTYLYILDLDGTIVDSLDDLTLSVNVMRNKYGLPSIDRQAVRGMVGQGARNLVERALPGFDAKQVDDGLALFLSHNEAHLCEQTTLYPEVPETLAQLAGTGHTLALLSNKHEHLCRKLLDHFNIDLYFSAVMGGDSLTARKPSPEPLLLIMNLLGKQPDQTFMVGDSINDIVAGRDAQVMTIACSYGYGGPDELVEANFCIGSFGGLLRLPPVLTK